MIIPSLIGRLFVPATAVSRPAFAHFRWTLLCVLRAAYRGELLKIGPTCIRSGTLTEPTVAEFIVEHGLVLPKPSSWARNISQLVLSDHGHHILAAGEAWWCSLSFPQRLFVALTE